MSVELSLRAEIPTGASVTLAITGESGVVDLTEYVPALLSSHGHRALVAAAQATTAGDAIPEDDARVPFGVIECDDAIGFFRGTQPVPAAVGLAALAEAIEEALREQVARLGREQGAPATPADDQGTSDLTT